jgi:excisionase family DNA binding protein
MPAPRPKKRSTNTRLRTFLTPAEVEELTGLGRWAVYHALRSGQLPGDRVGRRWLIGRDALDRMASGQAQP